jgi:hypothetical protein
MEPHVGLRVALNKVFEILYSRNERFSSAAQRHCRYLFEKLLKSPFIRVDPSSSAECVFQAL